MRPKHPHQQTLGKYGEDLAASYLRVQRYTIVQKNFKARYGEIDLVCLTEDATVFVEVKTRIGQLFGTPEESVTPRKIKEIIKTAQYYMLVHPQAHKSMRIDVVAIELTPEYIVKRLNHEINVSG